MSEKKKGEVVGIIFLILGIIMTFVFESIFGLIFSVSSLIFGIMEFRRKKIINYILLIVPSLIILFYIISFLSSVFQVNNALSSAKLSSYKSYELQLEKGAEVYVLINNQKYVDDDLVLTIDTLAEYNTVSKINSCDGYVIANPSNKEYNAYIKCKDYKTEGYNSKYTK